MNVVLSGRAEPPPPIEMDRVHSWLSRLVRWTRTILAVKCRAPRQLNVSILSETAPSATCSTLAESSKQNVQKSKGVLFSQ